MADRRRELFADEAPDRVDIRRRIRAAGDDRRTHEQGNSSPRKLPCVLEDDVVRHSRETPVDFRVHVLDVEQDEIDVGGRTCRFVPWESPARLDDDSDSGRGAQGGARCEEGGLQERFSSRKRHTPSRSSVEWRILKDGRKQIVGRGWRSEETPRPVRARGNTFPAAGARGAFGDASVPCRKGERSGAGRDAGAARRAAFGKDADFRKSVLRLRIAAPRAPKRTSLEECDRPDPRTVVK